MRKLFSICFCLMIGQFSFAQETIDSISQLNQDRHAVQMMYNQSIAQEELLLEQKTDPWFGRAILMGVLKGEHSTTTFQQGDKYLRICPQAQSIDEIRLIKFDVKKGNRVAKLSTVKIKQEIDLKDSKMNKGVTVPYKKLNDNFIELDCSGLNKGEYGVVTIVNNYYFANYAFTFSIQ
ncbi:MAG: hypothetical protein IKT00_05910 [Prevotella sp.]|nr:hypothetical protein [Prevotella sp.]